MTRAECVRPDTVPRPRHTLTLLSLLAALLAGAADVRATPSELAASVVWRRDDIVYIASADSAAFVPGMALSIARGRRELAQASVTRVLEPHLALARLGSGTLAHEKRLDRLRVLVRSTPETRPGSLRVGLPGRERRTLLFACGGGELPTRVGSELYAVDSLAPRRFRMRREPGVATGLAPDTLLVRFYAEAADQEIALERGELDVAVFWPGELSARLRGEERWRDFARGLRARGVVACVAAPADTLPPPPADLAAIDRDAFSGDLAPWSELEPTPGALAPAAPARWSVEPALPGARALERVLARSSAGPSARPLRLTYLDVPLAGHDSVQSAWRTRGVTPVFAVRCPVLAAPACRAWVASIGADAFANLIPCGRPTP